MKALAIVGAIAAAWISGVGIAKGNDPQQLGGVVFLVVAILCGMAAWGL